MVACAFDRLVFTPGLLLLDEATYNLEVAAEQAVLKHIKGLSFTTIICSHRPEAWAIANLVFSLESGRLTRRQEGLDEQE